MKPHIDALRPRLRLLFAVAACAMMALAAFALVVKAISPWYGELLLFFWPHVALIAVGALLAACLARRRAISVVAGCLCVAVAAPLLATVPRSNASASSNFRLLSANLLYGNPHKDLFKALVAVSAPDVIVTAEAILEWPAALRGMPGYPYVAGPDFDPWSGVMVISRRPIKAALVEGMPAFDRDYGGGQALRVELAQGEGRRPVVIYAIHPPTPRSEEGLERRNRYLDALVDQVATEKPGTPIIVAGDWNTPFWSPEFRDFLARARLRAAERSYWPDPTRLFSRLGVTLFGTPIDHVATSPDIGVKRMTIGRPFGSDHLPVIADLEVGQ